MAYLPQLLDYDQVKPRGIATEYKTTRFTPLSSFNSYTTNDIVRFGFRMVQGFWDPYKSYIQIEVQVDQADFPYGHCVQVDNSASSFINQMTIYCDGKQIQRLQQYDTVAAMLHDVMYRPDDKFGKQYEGTGYASHTSMGVNVDTRKTTMSGIQTGEPFGVTSQTNAYPANVSALVNHAIAPSGTYTSGYLPQFPRYIDSNQTWNANLLPYAAVDVNTAMKTSGSTSTLTKMFQLPELLGYAPRTSAQVLSSNFAGAKVNPPAVRIFPYLQSTQSYSLQPCGTDSAATAINVFSQKNLLAPRPYIQAAIQSSCYGLQKTSAGNFTLYNQNAYTPPKGLPPTLLCPDQLISPNYATSNVQKNGYTQAYSQQLSNGSNQPVIAPAHAVSWIHQGVFLNTPVQTNKRTFQIPILSSLLGVLIPSDAVKLLPMDALKQLMIQFRLNQYAMFTSGYKQNYTNSTVNRSFVQMNQQLQRKWKINRFQIYGAIYSFDDIVNQVVQQKLASQGIALSSCAWTLGPQFSISDTSLIQNTWQINLGYQSVQTVALRIQSDDYQKYSFCRQHYYYSGNITRFQLKIANQYIPPQPIQGHAGCIVPTTSQKNNAPFIIELHKTFGKLFNIGQSTYINATNFAVNDRPYDITNKLSYATVTTYPYHTVTNIDTASGLPNFHQNRCVGRALYALDLQALPNQSRVISGLNTIQWRPFQVILDCDTSIPTTRDATLIFMVYYDVVYLLQAGQAPTVYGKG